MRQRLRNELALITFAAAIFSFLKHRDKSAAGLTALAAGLRWLPLGKSFSLRGRHVVITGGSRGLGLALAFEVLSQGGKVTLLARDARELENAEMNLRVDHPGGEIFTLTCDVTHDADLATAIHEADKTLGPIDVVINNAGSIAVAPFECLDSTDFHAQMDLHLFAVVEMTRQMEKYFKARGGGRIVNISSIGGKIAVPHMSSYCASKFALSGFSRAVAAELKEHNIFVTTIYPGMMRTGSPIQAVFKGDAEKEYAWFQASDVMPGISLPARRAARRVLDACRNGDVEAVLSWPAKLGAFAFDNFPEITGVLSRIAARLLPHGTSRQAKTGAQSQALFKSSLWTYPLRQIEKRAEERFNQEPKSDPDFNLGV